MTVKYYSPKRRAIYARGEVFDCLEIFERDNWVCNICENPIDKSERYPSPKCATIDHIVPIAVCLQEGWDVSLIHTRSNVAAAHLECNLGKANSLPVGTDPAIKVEALRTPAMAS